MGGELYCFMPYGGESLYMREILGVTESQLNDGNIDCMFAADETCVWKSSTKPWQHPYKGGDFSEYFKFLELLATKPASSRWYTMATREEIYQLGHDIEVRNVHLFFHAIFVRKKIGNLTLVQFFNCIFELQLNLLIQLN